MTRTSQWLYVQFVFNRRSRWKVNLFNFGQSEQITVSGGHLGYPMEWKTQTISQLDKLLPLGPRLSYLLSAVQVHTATHNRSTPAKAGPVCTGLPRNIFCQDWVLSNSSDVSEKMKIRKDNGQRERFFASQGLRSAPLLSGADRNPWLAGMTGTSCKTMTIPHMVVGHTG